MRSIAVLAGVLCAFVVPANAERLKVSEVYRHLQGDWAEADSATDVERACAAGRTRLSLDDTGLVLTFQHLDADRRIRRSATLRLNSIPQEGDASVFLDFFGPEVDRTASAYVWQYQGTFSMSSPDRLSYYSGYAAGPDLVGADGRIIVSITPHGYGWDMVRCSPAIDNVPSDTSAPS